MTSARLHSKPHQKVLSVVKVLKKHPVCVIHIYSTKVHSVVKHGIRIGQAINPLRSCGHDEDLAVRDSPLEDEAQQVISRRFEFWTYRLKVFAPAERSSNYPAC